MPRNLWQIATTRMPHEFPSYYPRHALPSLERGAHLGRSQTQRCQHLYARSLSSSPTRAECCARRRHHHMIYIPEACVPCYAISPPLCRPETRAREGRQAEDTSDVRLTPVNRLLVPPTFSPAGKPVGLTEGNPRIISTCRHGFSVAW